MPREIDILSPYIKANAIERYKEAIALSDSEIEMFEKIESQAEEQVILLQKEIMQESKKVFKEDAAVELNKFYKISGKILFLKTWQLSP